MHLEERLVHGYIEEALDAADRAAVDRHLAGCAECRRLVDDLAEIRRAAAALDPREPPARAWSRIERAIGLEAEHTAARASRQPLAIWLAAAAALVLATLVGLRYTGRQPAPPAIAGAGAAATAAPAGDASAASIEAELRAAESHYDKAIKGLEQIAKAEQNALDPKTAATLQKNLAVIDQAINESRAAVRAQPSSAPAVDSLMENFKTKLALLQDTVSLINELRKGNDQGAARIVSGLKDKGN